LLLLTLLAAGACHKTATTMATTTTTGRGGNGAGGGAAPIPAPVFPLTSSANGRTFVDQNGVPFPILGEAAFTILSMPSLADATAYLDARAAAGFNTIFAEILTRNGTNAPKSALGDLPFTGKAGGGSYDGTQGTADLSTPNDAYFAYASRIIDLAAARGMAVVLYQLPWGYGGSSWWPDLVNAANSQAVAKGFGQYLAAGHGAFGGLKSKSNILWVIGSDMGQSSSPAPTTEGESRALAIAQGLAAGGATQLVTGDWNATSLATDEPAFAPYMQANGVYTYGGVFPSTAKDQRTYLASRAGYAYVPVAATQGPAGASKVPGAIPTFLKETSYEHSPFSPGDPASVRKCQYWSWLSGCTAGLIYGDEKVWPFASGTWMNALNDGSGQDMARMIGLIRAVAWQRLVPSGLGGMRRLVTSANGADASAGDSYVAASQSDDGKVLIAYLPPTGSGAQSLTIDLRSMAGPARARWWDPASATFTNVGQGQYSFAPSASAQSFTSPGNNAGGANDWVLVLDAQ
jgi:hypothetical protein